MEIPKKLEERFEKLQAKEQAIKNKIKSTLEYKRRKIDKDVKKYIQTHDEIKFNNIEHIGRSHGFYTSGTSFREDRSPHENVKVLPKRGA